MSHPRSSCAAEPLRCARVERTPVPMIISGGAVASSQAGWFPASAAVDPPPGYFESLGTARLQGRSFTVRDGLRGTPDVVVALRQET